MALHVESSNNGSGANTTERQVLDDSSSNNNNNSIDYSESGVVSLDQEESTNIQDDDMTTVSSVSSQIRDVMDAIFFEDGFLFYKNGGSRNSKRSHQRHHRNLNHGIDDVELAIKDADGVDENPVTSSSATATGATTATVRSSWGHRTPFDGFGATDYEYTVEKDVGTDPEVILARGHCISIALVLVAIGVVSSVLTVGYEQFFKK